MGCGAEAPSQVTVLDGVGWLWTRMRAAVRDPTETTLKPRTWFLPSKGTTTNCSRSSGALGRLLARADRRLRALPPLGLVEDEFAVQGRGVELDGVGVALRVVEGNADIDPAITLAFRTLDDGGDDEIRFPVFHGLVMNWGRPLWDDQAARRSSTG